MRHIKLIIVIAAVTFAAVFVARHLMWMKGLEKGPEVKRLSDSSVRETVREEQKYQDHRGSMESPVIHEEETAVVQEGHIPAERPAATGQQQERPDHAKSVRDARPLQEDTERIYEKDAGEMIDYSGRGKKDLEKENEKKAFNSGKTSSITLKNKTVSVTHKNSSPPQPVREPVREVNNNSAQHPTSTAPQ